MATNLHLPVSQSGWNCKCRWVCQNLSSLMSQRNRKLRKSHVITLMDVNVKDATQWWFKIKQSQPNEKNNFFTLKSTINTIYKNKKPIYNFDNYKVLIDSKIKKKQFHIDLILYKSFYRNTCDRNRNIYIYKNYNYLNICWHQYLQTRSQTDLFCLNSCY